MLDISDYLHRNFHGVNPYGNPPTDYRVDCPFCAERVGSDDNKGHLHVGIDLCVCHCFRCEYSNTWIGMVMDQLGLSYGAAKEELHTNLPLVKLDELRSLLTKHARIAQEAKARLIQFTLPGDFEPLHSRKNSHILQAARKYMERRGFGHEYWERYQLGVAGSVGYRVIIPIEGDYWQARALHPALTPKYTAPSVPSHDMLFQSVALSKCEDVVVTEGALSAMAVGENAVALVGKNPTRAKVMRLLASPVRRFIITLEHKAYLSMLVLADTLVAHDREVVLWNYKEGQDPANAKPISTEDYGFATKITHLLNQY